MQRPIWQRTATLLFLTIFVLTGCIGGKDSAPETPRDPVELVMAYSNFGYISRNVLDDVVRDYERKNTHVRIRLVEFRGPERKSDGTWDWGPLENVDLILGGSGNIRFYFNEGLLRDLSQVPQPNWDPLVSPFVESLSVLNGERVMMPMVLTVDRMFYNPEIFDTLGFPAPAPNWTYGEFEELLRQLKDAGRPADIMYHNLLDHMLRASGGGFYDEVSGEWAFDTPTNREVLSDLIGMVEDGLVAVEYDGFLTTFGPDATPLINTIIYPQPQGYDWLPYPRGVAGRKSNLGAQGVAVMSSTPQPEEATAFLQALVSSDAALKALADAGHRPLVENGEAMQIWRDKVGAERANLLEEVIADGWTNPGVAQPFSYYQEIMDLLSGKRTLDDVLLELERRLN